MPDAADLLATLPPIAEEDVGWDALDTRLAGADQPVVMRNIAARWPLVVAGREGGPEVRRYLIAHARDRLFEMQIGRPGLERVFYDEHMALDFRVEKVSLAEAFALLEQAETLDSPPLVYLPSIEIQAYFDGLDRDNRLPLGARATRDGIWIGGRTKIAAHNDIAHNVAVAASGRRRFTLFPPGQFANLYLGPLEHSPGGRPISMVDLAAPAWDSHPRFRAALAEARVAELEPGDALFIPSCWYHHVEGRDRFNVLVNYWWNDEPRFLGHPEDALYHAILAIRDLPQSRREHWRALFDHYVFSADPSVAGHIPEAARGILAPLDARTAQQLRAYLLRRLTQ
ncbi:MAG: cupin-like domain-containing protein [Sphingomicrobium sp.]